MAISFVGYAAGVAGFVTLPGSWAAGDLAVVLAVRVANDVSLPDVPSGWVTEDTGVEFQEILEQAVQLQDKAAVLAYRVLEAGDDLTNWLQNATMAVAVYRGQDDTYPLGVVRGLHGLEAADGSNSLSLPRTAPEQAGWLVALAEQAPAHIREEPLPDLTNRSGAVGSSYLAADSNGVYSGVWPGAYIDTRAFGGAQDGQDAAWFSWVVEIRPPQATNRTLRFGPELDIAGRVPIRLREPEVELTIPPITLIPGPQTIQVAGVSVTATAGIGGGGGGGAVGAFPGGMGIPANTKRIPPPRAGYTRTYYTDFPANQAQIGPPTAATLAILRDSPSGTWDSSQRGKYEWEKTTREHDSVLDMWLHTEYWNQTTRSHVANPTGLGRISGQDPSKTYPGFSVNGDWVNYVARPLAQANRQLIQDITWTMYYPLITTGRKMANLLWVGPRVGEPGYGEEDFPEGHLTGGLKGNAFHHLEGTSEQRSAQLNTNLQAWHQYQIRFHARGADGHPTGYVEFWLDGVRVPFALSAGSPAGHITLGVPAGAMFFALQIETLLKSDTIATSGIQEGHCLMDEFAIDLPT